MSYKDLEAEIRAWANLEDYAKQNKEAAQESKRIAKRLKREAKLNAPLVPKVKKDVQAPINTRRLVILMVRTATDRVWGEATKVGYYVDTAYETTAELVAIGLANKEGWHWVSTVSTKLT